MRSFIYTDGDEDITFYEDGTYISPTLSTEGKVASFWRLAKVGECTVLEYKHEVDGKWLNVNSYDDVMNEKMTAALIVWLEDIQFHDLMDGVLE